MRKPKGIYRKDRQDKAGDPYLILIDFAIKSVVQLPEQFTGML